MKHTRVSLLALSALAGGVLSASAVDAGSYTLYGYLTNNPSPELVTVYGLPGLNAAKFVPGKWGVVTTDGAGKIDGVWDLSVTNLSGFGAGLTEGVFIVDVTGSVKGKGKDAPATVKMSVKGNGYVQTPGGGTMEEGSISYSFTGTRSNRSSSVGPFTTNVLVIGLSTTGTTNYTYSETYALTTNTSTYTSGHPAYSDLSFYVNSSVNQSTNATATNNIITQENEAYFDDGDISPIGAYRFGTPVAGSYTNDTLTLYWEVVGTNGTALITNVFNTFVIGTNIDIYVYNGVIQYSNVYERLGFDIAQMGLFINAYDRGRHYTFTNDVPAGNFVMRSVETNSYEAYLDTSTSTDIDDGIDDFESSWDEILGSVKGRVKAAKQTMVLDGAAKFSEDHYVYATIPGTNGVIVFETYVDETATYWRVDDASEFRLRVVSAGKKIYLDGDEWFPSSSGGFYGSGSLNSAKSNFNASVKGKGFAKGSNMKFDGTTYPEQLALAITNFVTFTNIAAFPEVSILASNRYDYTDYTPWNYRNFLTNTVGTNVFEATSYYRYLPIPPAFANTNLVDVIYWFDMSGKVKGQKLSGSGWND